MPNRIVIEDIMSEMLDDVNYIKLSVYIKKEKK